MAYGQPSPAHYSFSSHIPEVTCLDFPTSNSLLVIMASLPFSLSPSPCLFVCVSKPPEKDLSSVSSYLITDWDIIFIWKRFLKYSGLKCALQSLFLDLPRGKCATLVSENFVHLAAFTGSVGQENKFPSSSQFAAAQ